MNSCCCFEYLQEALPQNLASKTALPLFDDVCEKLKVLIMLDSSIVTTMLTMLAAISVVSAADIPQPPRYLLYRVLEPLGPYIVGTWAVRVLIITRKTPVTAASLQLRPGSLCTEVRGVEGKQKLLSVASGIRYEEKLISKTTVSSHLTCTHLCMYACIYIYICIYVYVYVQHIARVHDI